MSRNDFGHFLVPILSQYPSIQAMAWVPRVEESHRMEYEINAKLDGFPDFQIVQKGSDGKMIPVGPKEEYFPVYFCEPFTETRISLGFDLSSNEIRRKALERSRKTGRLIATEKMILVMESQNRFGFIVLAPVYNKNTSPDMASNDLRGFAVGAFRIGDIVEGALTHLKIGDIGITLYDRSASEDQAFLYSRPADGERTSSNSGSRPVPGETPVLTNTDTFDVAGREWQIVTEATPRFARSRKNYQPVGATATVLLLTVMLAGYTVIRKQNEKKLRAGEEKFRSVVRCAPDAIFVLAQGRFVFFNEATLDLLGIASEELLIGRSIEDFIHPDAKMLVLERLRSVCEEKKTLPLMEQKYIRSDGTETEVEVASVPYEFDKVAGALVFMRDIAGRKITEQKLSKMNEYLENIFVNSPDGIGIVDQHGRFIRWNKIAAEQFGYTSEELSGKPSRELYANQDDYTKMVHELRQHGGISKYEIDMKRKDGFVAAFELSISLLKDDSGEIIGSVCVARDLSAMKKALKAVEASNELLQEEIAHRLRVEESLRKSEHEFREILETVNLLAVSLDVGGRIVFCNNFFLTATGWQRDEIMGLDWFEAVFPEGSCDLSSQDYREQLVQGEIAPNCEEEITTYLGKRILIAWHNTVLKDSDGNIVGTTRIGQDIGLRRQMEKELRDASAEMELLIAFIPSILIELSWANRIIRWNFAAEKTFMLSPDEIVGNRLEVSPIPWDAERVSDIIAQCTSGRTIVTAKDIRFFRHDGTEGLMDITVSPIISEPDELSGIIILGSDVTEQRLLERQLSQAQKLESIGQLAAGIAHEINTPTQYVGDNVRFLQDAFHDIETLLDKYGDLPRVVREGASPDEVERLITEAQEQADIEYLREEAPKAIAQSLEGVSRVSRIVLAMKEFSHPGTTEKVSVDINRAVESTITVARNEWKYVADMVTDFDSTLPFVPCLPGELNQVVLNLIINASHAVADARGNDEDRKGTITVRTRNLGDRVLISVGDTGTGIPENIRPRIFDPFFTTKQVGKGTGQGLAIAYSVIVEKHGGEIRFETEVGKGTTFIIVLPIADGKESEGGDR